MENQDGFITIVDENGNEAEAKILFTFEDPETAKKYVVYLIPTPEEEEAQQVGAAQYVDAENGEGMLIDIETEEEWDMIDEVLQYFMSENSESEIED